VNEKPAPVAALSPAALPPDLEVLIADCLAKDPEERPQSIFALQERLESLPGLGKWTQAAAAEWWQGRFGSSRPV